MVSTGSLQGCQSFCKQMPHRSSFTANAPSKNQQMQNYVQHGIGMRLSQFMSSLILIPVNLNVHLHVFKFADHVFRSFRKNCTSQGFCLKLSLHINKALSFAYENTLLTVMLRCFGLENENCPKTFSWNRDLMITSCELNSTSYEQQ